MKRKRIKNQGAAAGVIFACFLLFMVGVFVLAWRSFNQFERDVRRRIDEGTADIGRRIEAAFGVRVQGSTRELAISEDAGGTFAKVVIATDQAGWVAAQLEAAGFIAMDNEAVKMPAGDPPDWWKLDALAEPKVLGRPEPIERSGGGGGGTVRAWWATTGKGVVLYLRKLN